MKKIGAYLKSVLPLLVVLLLQFSFAVIQMLRFILQYGLEGGMQSYMNSTSTTLLIANFLILGVMWLWYYIQVIRSKRREGQQETSLFAVKDLGLILLLAVGMQFLTSILLTAWGIVSPGLLEDYTDLVDSVGIDQMGIVTILSVAIIGPIEEELTFRGLTIHILKRTDASFWVINVIQALLFGIMHLNLVQGSYAFIMGLVAGYLVMRYHSLWAGIAFHILFNSYSFVSSLLSGILRKIPNLLLLLIFLVVGTLLVVFSLRSISSELRQREEATEKESC